MDKLFNLSDTQLARYSRHLLMDDIGEAGQLRWLNSHVVLVGCGGLGSACAPYLAASGVGQITLLDHDVVELSNLQRQVSFYTSNIGQYKANALASRLQAINPDVHVTALTERASESLLAQYASASHLLIDCTDNFATRQLINQMAYQYRLPLVSGSAIRMNGQVAVYHSHKSNSPCYACAFAPTQHNPDEVCATMGVFSPLVGIVGAYQATLALQTLLDCSSAPTNQILHFDVLRHEWHRFHINKDPNCPVCTS